MRSSFARQHWTLFLCIVSWMLQARHAVHAVVAKRQMPGKQCNMLEEKSFTAVSCSSLQARPGTALRVPAGIQQGYLPFGGCQSFQGRRPQNRHSGFCSAQASCRSQIFSERNCQAQWETRVGLTQGCSLPHQSCRRRYCFLCCSCLKQLMHTCLAECLTMEVLGEWFRA